MISLYFDTAPLANNHAIRGIGAYTKFLLEALRKFPEELSLSTDTKDRSSVDYIHYPYFDLFFATLPLRFLSKTFVTIHDVIPLEFPDYYKAGVKGNLRFLRQKAIVRRVAGVITDSEYSKKKINHYLDVPLEKIFVTYLAANPLLHSQEKSLIREVMKKYSLPEKYLLYVGDINYNKNIPQLIKALKFVDSEVTLVCVGKNFTEQEIPEWQWITTQMAMSEVTNRVIFLPDITSSDSATLSALYSGAQAYIQPSLSEGFGLPVLEALQCGCPVIASNRASLPEVGGNACLYTEPTAEAIADKITQVLEWSKREREDVIEKGIEWAKNFTWKKTAKETIAAYEKKDQK